LDHVIEEGLRCHDLDETRLDEQRSDERAPSHRRDSLGLRGFEVHMLLLDCDEPSGLRQRTTGSLLTLLVSNPLVLEDARTIVRLQRCGLKALIARL
jgi:hypothetical protein